MIEYKGSNIPILLFGRRLTFTLRHGVAPGRLLEHSVD